MNNAPEETPEATDTIEIVSELPEDDRHRRAKSKHELLLAATYIEDARSGWKLSLHFDPSPRNLSYYLAFRNVWGKYLLYLVLGVHMSLALFEEPTWHTLQVNYLYPACVELFCVAFYVYRCLHLLSFTSPGWFWKDVKNLAVIAVILLTIIDILVYMGMKETGLDHGVRWSRPLRPLLMVNIPESRQIRRAWRSVSRTLPDVAGTMVLFVLNLLLFALMAYKLFGSRGMKYANGRPYFATYQDSLFDLYVLVTTANSPDVMMPALNASPPMFLFFVVFVLISLYLFMNVILAVIYNSYRTHLKKDVQTAVAARRLLMSRAFSLLGGGGAVAHEDYVRVMSVLRPTHGPQLVDILWRVLDPHGAGQLGERDLYQLADLLNVRVTEVKDRVTLLARLMPGCFNSRPAVLVRRVVRQRWFRLFFDVLIVVNAITIALDADQAEWAFLTAFIIEILLKMYTFGFREFFDRLWNMFDFVVIGGAFLISVVRASTGVQAGNTLVLDVLLLFRCLRVVKLMDSIAVFRAVLRTIASFSRSIVTYAGVLFCLYYFFALLGMELFADRVLWAPFRPGRPTDCGDRLLKDTDFAKLQYCANNFNSLPAALAVLFELMVVNQWHVIAEGYAAVTTQWAKLYFIAFHLCCVVILLNIFTAFILEAFILEFTTERTTTESKVERKIAELGLGLGSRLPDQQRPSSATTGSDGAASDYTTLVESDELDADHDPRPSAPAAEGGGGADLSATTTVRFHIDRRARSVEVLLQRMFESGDTQDVWPSEPANGNGGC